MFITLLIYLYPQNIQKTETGFLENGANFPIFVMGFTGDSGQLSFI